LQQFGEFLLALLGRLATDRRVAARAQAPGELLADVHLGLRFRVGERLQVRVDRDELDAAELRPDHAVDRVAAAATDADHFDAGVPLQGPVDVAHGFLLVALQARPYEPFGRHPRALASAVITRDHGPRGEALHSKLIVDVHIGLLPLRRNP